MVPGCMYRYLGYWDCLGIVLDGEAACILEYSGTPGIDHPGKCRGIVLLASQNTCMQYVLSPDSPVWIGTYTVPAGLD